MTFRMKHWALCDFLNHNSFVCIGLIKFLHLTLITFFIISCEYNNFLLIKIHVFLILFKRGRSGIQRILRISSWSINSFGCVEINSFRSVVAPNVREVGLTFVKNDHWKDNHTNEVKSHVIDMIDEKYTLMCDNSLENIENKDDDAVN